MSYSSLVGARDQLRDLGQDVSSIEAALSYQNISASENVPYQNVAVFDDSASFSGESVNGRLEQERTAASTQRREAPLRLARASAADLESLTRPRHPAASSSTQQSNTMRTSSSSLQALNMQAPSAAQQLNVMQTPSSSLRSLNMPHAQSQENHTGSKRMRTDTAADDRPSQRMRSRDAMPPPQLPSRRPVHHEPGITMFPMDSLSPPRFHHPSTTHGAHLAQSRNASDSPATATGHISPFDFRPRNDGELDSLRFHQPSPQRPLYAPNSVSPARERLTLTPRNRAPSRGTGPGLLSHARSSSVPGMLTPRSSSTTASHRQPLGLAQSPYFGSRELPAARTGMDPRIMNGLSFVEDPVIGSGGGRRRARR